MFVFGFRSICICIGIVLNIVWVKTYDILCAPYGSIQKHILNETSIVNKCTAIVIRDLCNARDSNVYIMLDNEYISIIDILCTESVFTVLFYVILYYFLYNFLCQVKNS